MWYTVNKEKEINHRGVKAKEDQHVWLTEAQATLHKDSVTKASKPKDASKCASSKCWELAEKASQPKTKEKAEAKPQK